MEQAITNGAKPKQSKIISLKNKFRLKRGALVLPYFVLALIFVVTPLFILLVQAFISFDGGFTLSNITRVFTGGGLRLFLRSMYIAGVTTIICLVIAYPVALLLASKKIKVPLFIITLFIVPMLINVVIRTFALREIFLWIERSITRSRGEPFSLHNDFKIIVALCLDYFPFMLLPIYTVLRSQDWTLLEASSDLGASNIRTLTKVTFPLSIPGIISGITMVFMPAISNFAIPLIVIPVGDGSELLYGNRIWFMFGSRATYNQGAAYALFLLAVILVSFVLIAKLTKGKSKGLVF